MQENQLVPLLDVLAELASRGGIGALRCGAPMAEVSACLGEPVDLGPVRKRRYWPHRFCYGDVEFVACRCERVDSVRLSLMRNSPWELLGETLGGGRPTLDEMTGALDAAGCPWMEGPERPEGQLVIRTEPAADVRAELVFTVTEDLGFRAASPRLVKAAAWTEAIHDCVAHAG